MANLNIKNNISAQGNINPDQNDTRALGDGISDWSAVYTHGLYTKDSVVTNLIPDTDGVRDLGSSSKKWKNLYVQNMQASSLTGVNLVPSGTIMIWSGTVSNIPSGWVLCDGNNGTPDLRDRFPASIGDTYDLNDTGGQNAITQVPAHTHSVSGNVTDAGSHAHSGNTGSPIDVTTASLGSSTTTETQGPFYSGSTYWQDEQILQNGTTLIGSSTIVYWFGSIVASVSGNPSTVTVGGWTYSRGVLQGSQTVVNTPNDEDITNRQFYAVIRERQTSTTSVGNVVSNSTGGAHQHGYSDYGSTNATQSTERGAPDGFHRFASSNSFVNRTTQASGSHTHDIVLNLSTTHSHSLTGTTASTGSSSVDTRPPYYALLYVMKT